MVWATQPAHLQRLVVVVVMLLHVYGPANLAWSRHEQPAPLVDIGVGSAVGFQSLFVGEVGVTRPCGSHVACVTELAPALTVARWTN